MQSPTILHYPGTLEFVIAVTVPSNHDKPLLFEEPFTSLQYARKVDSSDCKKCLKLCAIPSSWCAATLCRNFSSALRLDSTNSVENRPMVCLSGNGGTITPGKTLDSSDASHAKSLYLRSAVKFPRAKPSRDVLEEILYLIRGYDDRTHNQPYLTWGIELIKE